ncbi:hypothetical protein, partial [Modestobacter roseus]
MSRSESAIEQMLQRWEAKNPGTPVRPVVQQAVDLGFVVAEPTSSARYLRLVLDAPGGSVTLYADAQRLTAAGAGLRDLAGSLPGAVVRPRDVQFPFDAADPGEVLEGFRAAATGETAHPPTAELPAAPEPASAAPRTARLTPTRAAAAVAALLFVIALLVGGTAASSETDADTASSGTEATAPATP